MHATRVCTSERNCSDPGLHDPCIRCDVLEDNEYLVAVTMLDLKNLVMTGRELSRVMFFKMMQLSLRCV